jgi:lipopolysaccharide transport system ATP-binding protein
MPAPVLTVADIGKSYRSYGSELKRVASWFGAPFQPVEEQWVLRNINLTVSPGETVGIVGQNGAGKSTLLKIIAGTLKPTTGQFAVAGRISAILELGMGFHPDLTGRQNVYHSAGLTGYAREQIDGLIGAVEAFAEIGGYFDQPVRTYSSGMQVRVAFSVATMSRPDILIVDEALSVGDVYFQHKSFDRIRQFQNEGTTLLIVSHDRAAIQAICTRALLLDRGSVIKDGNPEVVMDFYNALIADQENRGIEQKALADGKVQTVSGSREALIESAVLTDGAGQPLEFVSVAQEVELILRVRAAALIPELVAGFAIRDRLGQDVFGTNSFHLGKVLRDVPQGTTVTYRYRFRANLGVGSYSVAVAAHGDYSHLSANYHWLDRAVVFTVVNVNKQPFTGLTWFPVDLDVES